MEIRAVTQEKFQEIGNLETDSDMVYPQGDVGGTQDRTELTPAGCSASPSFPVFPHGALSRLLQVLPFSPFTGQKAESQRGQPTCLRFCS